MGVDNVYVESNCLNVCQSINKYLLNLSYDGIIISNCLQLISTFNALYIHFISCSVNNVAHNLTIHYSSLTGFVSWDLEPPMCIRDLLFGF